MNVPKEVAKAANGYIKLIPGSELIYLGEYDGAEAYYVAFPDNMIVGYPPVFLYKEHNIKEVVAEDALDIISQFWKEDEE